MTMPFSRQTTESTKNGCLLRLPAGVGKTATVDSNRIYQASFPEFPRLSSGVIPGRLLSFNPERRS